MKIVVCGKGAYPASWKIFFLLLSTAWLLSLSAKAVPLYNDTPEADKKALSPGDLDAQFRADQIRNLTDYIQKTYRVASDKALTIVTEAISNGVKYDLDPELILAIIAVESTFREDAVSHVGARGLMQVMPRWHPEKIKEIGGAHALFDPKKNIYTGSKILVKYLAWSGGNLKRALLRYNGSLSIPNSRYPDKVLRIYNDLRQINSLMASAS